MNDDFLKNYKLNISTSDLTKKKKKFKKFTFAFFFCPLQAIFSKNDL